LLIFEVNDLLGCEEDEDEWAEEDPKDQPEEVDYQVEAQHPLLIPHAFLDH